MTPQAAPACGVRRHRLAHGFLIWQVVDALQRSCCELSEPLLELYLGGMGRAASAHDPTQWAYSVFTFGGHGEGGSEKTLRLRSRASLGGGAETGCMLWDAARALSAWVLDQPAEDFAGGEVEEREGGEGGW